VTETTNGRRRKWKQSPAHAQIGRRQVRTQMTLSKSTDVAWDKLHQAGLAKPRSRSDP